MSETEPTESQDIEMDVEESELALARIVTQCLRRNVIIEAIMIRRQDQRSQVRLRLRATPDTLRRWTLFWASAPLVRSVRQVGRTPARASDGPVVEVMA